MPDVTNNVTNPIKIPIESATKWHAIELSYKNGEIKFTVDYRKSQSKMFGLSLNIGHKVIIGSSLRSEYTRNCYLSRMRYDDFPCRFRPAVRFNWMYAGFGDK